MASSRAGSIKTGGAEVCEAAGGVEVEVEAEVEGGRVGVDEGEEGRATMAGGGVVVVEVVLGWLVQSTTESTAR
jgi:hypothetical protein